ncbi:6-phosphofructokinase [Pirellulaceae bacterium]|jgi:ATP-dependent phosphofructokinase / diphosphate-dependent phosphofructokinase|nr:6-phosphofructokinase [Pirellulaceae bacterium]
MSNAPGIKRVAILFAGGPAPAANAVISAAAASFLRNDSEAIGIKHGYSSLMEYDASRPLVEGRDYIPLTHEILSRTRNAQGIMIGTARANPGKNVSSPSHLDDLERVAPLQKTYDALCSLEVDALISIGGDDTLKTANKFCMFQKKLPAGAKKIPVVHLPKTIDNDYHGIDFTFGFFTAVDFLATEIRNLIYDASAGRAFFLAEAMGRSAGWLAYGAAMAGEASLVLSVEDIIGEFLTQETHVNEVTGESQTRPIMDIDIVLNYMVDLMLTREKEGKEFGVIVIAEGLAEFLPMKYLEGVPRDDHGHIAISEVNLNRRLAKLLTDKYTERTGRHRKINGVQLGYEARCTKPHAFDVMLGSQLGVGAYRALVEEGLNGVMVSVEGQLELIYQPFEKLVDPETLVTKVRFIETGCDYHKLARFLETQVNTEE